MKSQLNRVVEQEIVQLKGQSKNDSKRQNLKNQILRESVVENV